MEVDIKGLIPKQCFPCTLEGKLQHHKLHHIGIIASWSISASLPFWGVFGVAVQPAFRARGSWRLTLA